MQSTDYGARSGAAAGGQLCATCRSGGLGSVVVDSVFQLAFGVVFWFAKF